MLVSCRDRLVPYVGLLAGLGGCALVSDFDRDLASSSAGGGPASTAAATSTSSGGPSTGSGGAAGPTSGSASTGTGPGGGGAGGAAPCGGADLTSDPLNCGACDFACDAEACVAGQCGATLDLAGYGAFLRAVVVDGDLLFLAMETTLGGNAGFLYTVPVDFTGASTASLAHPVPNTVGGLIRGTVGARHVYFSGQSNRFVTACEPTACTDVEISNGLFPGFVQVQGKAAVGDLLYLLVNDGWSLASVPLDATTGLPGPSATPLVTTYASPIDEGTNVLAAASGSLYWNAFDGGGQGDGCLFRESTGNLPAGGPVSCWSDPFSARGAMVVDGAGVAYAEAGTTLVVKVELANNAPVGFVDNAKGPLGVDDDFLYASDATTHAIRAMPTGGGPEAGRTEVPAELPYVLDASHPDYVFYTAGSVLHRWPKPRP